MNIKQSIIANTKIFNNNLNNKYKLIPFNIKLTDYRDKYEAPVSKEWKNTLYSFYKNTGKNLSINHLNLDRIIQIYFDFFFINKFIHLKDMSFKRRSSILRRIYVSNVEIKQTNNKAIITLYIINTEKLRLLYRYRDNISSVIYKIISKSKMEYNFNMNKFIRSEYNKLVSTIKKTTETKFATLQKIQNTNHILFYRKHKDSFWKIFNQNFSLDNKTHQKFQTIIKHSKLHSLCLNKMENSPALLIYKWFYLSYQTIFFLASQEKKLLLLAKQLLRKENKIEELKMEKKILKETLKNISIMTISNIKKVFFLFFNPINRKKQTETLVWSPATTIDKLFKNIGLKIRKNSYAYNYYYLKLNKTYFYLFKLNNLFTRILNKKIEFNIINLKSLVYSTDIFTKALSLKLRKTRNFSLHIAMDSLINRVKLPGINTIKERINLKEYKDMNLVYNKFQDTYLFSLQTDNLLLEHFLKEIQTKKKVNLGKTIFQSIFNSIKHKNIGGIRLEVKGRLTKRYRADRALYKLKWKGSLQNIESSYNKLSSILYRGHFKPNVTYSVINTKRRVGSFAVKGWMSGK